MKPHIPREKPFLLRLKPQLLAWSVAACFASSPLWALPGGAQIAAGTVGFNQVGNTLNIANTPGAIINWNDFSIGALEAVRFNQQNSLSAVLNRVTGTSASAIHGALSSNGRVFLINPNGILFGAGSRIDVNGLIASTLDISDLNFRAGRLDFLAGGTAGALRNEGSLQAPGGNIYLIAPDIENGGIVRAPNGAVLLAAGRQVSLVDGAHPDIQVVVSAPADKAVNLGAIAAGKVGVFGALLTQRGTASADTVETDGAGRIVFRAAQQLNVAAGSRTTANGPTGGAITLQTTAGDTYVEGTVEATGSQGTGGTIGALGHRVAVMDDAVLDASGAAGGGRIMVGGDYQGGNPAVQNAQTTYFGPHATLKANAGKVGAGGTVIVWADDTTRAHGAIEARGGPGGGNGGFVETSGNYLETAGIRIDLGEGGTWLLDPYDITIGANTSNSTNDAAIPLTFTGTASTAEVEASLINAALDAGTSVIVDTTGAGADVGDITVNTAITKASGGDAGLTLKAHDDIFVNVPIGSTFGKLDVTLLADQTGTAPSGSITIAGSGSVTTNNGDFSASGKSIGIGGAGIATATGNIALTATSGTITQTAGITGAALNINNADSATLNHASNAVGSLTASGNGTLNFTTGGALAVASINKSTANVYLVANNAISQTGATTADQLDVESVADAVTLGDTGNVVAIFKGQAQGSILFKNNGAFEAEAVSDTGDVTLYNLGSGNISTFGDSFGLKAVAGDITINGNLNNIGSVTVGSVAAPIRTLSVSGDFTQGQMGVLNLFATDTSNHGSVSVTGTATLDGYLTIGGTSAAGSYSILSASAISGSFASITSDYTFDAASGVLTVPVPTITYTWDGGGGDGLWLTPANWNSDTLPTAAEHVELGAAAVSLSGGAAAAKDISCSGSCALTVDDALTLSGDGTLHDLILGASGSITGSGSNSLTVSNSFSQNTAAAITNFRYVALNNAAGLVVGNISTNWTGDYVSGSTTGVIKLSSSGGSIGQYAGTALAGAAIRADSYSGVILEENNATGVVAANVSMSGDFKYRSSNPIRVDNVDGLSGISVPGFVKLQTSDDGAAFSQSAPIVAPAGLLLVGNGSGQSVSLLNAANAFPLLAANLSSASTVEIMHSGASMTVDSVDSVNGITATGATKLRLVNSNSSGSLTIAEPIAVDASTTEVEFSTGSGGLTISQPLSAKTFSLRADGTISLTAALTASDWVHLSNYATGGTFRINSGGCSGACIDIADFPDIAAPSGVAFGDTDTQPTGSLQVNAAIDTATFAGATKPAFVALLAGSGSGDSISFSASSPITLPAGGHFVFDGYNITNQATSSISAAKVAGKANVATLYFTGVDTSITSFTTLESTPETYGGITTTGNLWMSHGAANGFLNGGGILAAPTLTVSAGSIGTAADKLVTQLDSLIFTAQAEGAFIANHTAAVPGAMSITGTANSSAPSGSVIISNHGATTIAAGGISADGSITVTANSPLTISGAVSSTAGAVSLTSSNGDPLTINSNVSASTGVSLTAGSGGTLSVAGGSAVTTSTGTLALAAGSVTGTGTVGGVAATSASFTNTAPTPSAPTAPTVDACVADPSLAGCSTVLPTLDACIANPAAAGCSVVLPSVDTCVANPTAAGCSTVLPSLSTCETAPTTTGCSVILPPLATCTTAPTTAGCSAVLPSVDACVANPAAAGCSTVLPSLATCQTAPTTTGCSVILPSLATCTTVPTTPGCSAVLPSVDACVANPTAAGCSTVLPSLATCQTAPTTTGCSVILPPLATCTTAPTTAGCSAVLPSVDACVANPTAAGCSTVLPSLATCETAPTTTGCSVILPPLATCATAPTTAGCAAVLPSVDACVANPAATGCSAVLPPLATCATAPTTPGCSAVLPAPTLPTDQQLACLLNPAACAPDTTAPPPDTAQPIIEQFQSSEQQLVLNARLGQSETGRPDLALMQTTSSSSSGAGGGSGGGGSGSSGAAPGGATPSSGEAQGQSGTRPDEEEQNRQTAKNDTQPGATNAPPQRRFCN